MAEIEQRVAQTEQHIANISRSLDAMATIQTKLGDAMITLAQAQLRFEEESRETQLRLADLGRETDLRISGLVSAIGEFIRKVDERRI